MKPRYKVDLRRQQADYEANYQRLLRLMPNIHKCNRWQYIIGNDHTRDSDVTIEVQERAKYTTTIQLLQYYRSHNMCNENAITVRLYHDANLAEVLSWQHYRNLQARYNYPNRHMHQCDEKAQLNRFFGELLAHCLLHGQIADPILPATING